MTADRTAATPPPADASAPARRWMPELEALRAFALVAVVFSHAFWTLHDVAHTPLEIGVLGAILGVTRPAVPVFLTVSSLLLARKVASEKRPRLWPAARRILVAYVAWTVLYLLLTKVLMGTPAIAAADLGRLLVQDLLTGEAAAHLWYLVVALQLYLVVPVLVWWLVGRPGRELALFAVWCAAASMVLLGQVGGPLASNPIVAQLFQARYDRWFVPWIAYIGLGIALGLAYDAAVAWLERYRLVVLGVWAACSAGIAWLVVSRSLLVNGDYFASIDPGRITQPWIVPYEVLSIVAWLLVARLLVRTRLERPLSFVGAVSFGGYLTHPLVLYIGWQYVYGHISQPDAVTTTLVLFALSLGLSILMSWLLGRGQLGAALVGGRPARPKARPQAGAEDAATATEAA